MTSTFLTAVIMDAFPLRVLVTRRRCRRRSQCLRPVWRAIAASFLIALLLAGCGGAPASVWIDNQSTSDAAVFVTDNSSSPASWYIVPAGAKVHVGSGGLGASRDVRVNVLGWLHDVDNVAACAPGDYDGSLYDVAPGAAVRLLIDTEGRPSVGLLTEPAGLRVLRPAPLGPMSESERCAALDS